MIEVENKFKQPLEDMLPQMVTEYGLTASADQHVWKTSFSSQSWYVSLKKTNPAEQSRALRWCWWSRLFASSRESAGVLPVSSTARSPRSARKVWLACRSRVGGVLGRLYHRHGTRCPLRFLRERASPPGTEPGRSDCSAINAKKSFRSFSFLLVGLLV